MTAALGSEDEAPNPRPLLMLSIFEEDIDETRKSTVGCWRAEFVEIVWRVAFYRLCITV